jgi:ribosomal protein S12 methylthiotransferase
LDFVEAIQFDKVGVFTFSPEPGTPAFDLPDQTAAEVKAERYDRLMSAQQRISLARNQAQVGRTLDVLVESVGKLAGRSGGQGLTDSIGRRGPVSLGRSYRDAPEVDGLVVIPGELPVGQMAQAKITGALAYDLVGECDYSITRYSPSTISPCSFPGGGLPSSASR